MNESILLQLTKEELSEIVNEAVRSAISGESVQTNPEQLIKGIHALAKFLHISPSRAQKLKNEGVVPYFQDGRMVLFDPVKVWEGMQAFNQTKKRRK
jgi:hypothetical protein